MRLAELLPGFCPDTMPDVLVSGFALDSRQIKPDMAGMVFVALAGSQQHGLNHAAAAVANGAVAVLYEPVGAPELPVLDVPLIAVPALVGHCGRLAATVYGDPSAAMAIVGVTGTDGKTSVTHFIANALNVLGRKTAVMGTIGIGLPGALRSATHTTPDVFTVQQQLQHLSQAGFVGAAMEVSSHALDQQRVDGVRFAIAVLTNLTRDHLDYHGTVEAYAAAKRKLFNWDGLQACVLNIDDEFGQSVFAALQAAGKTVLGYSLSGATTTNPADRVVARHIQYSSKGIQAEIVSPYGRGTLQVGVLGRFNLENLLASLGVLLVSGIDFDDALAALAQVNTVPGRMETVSSGQHDLLTVVDYAHTPGALASVLQAVRIHTRAQLICVFGCGGDRDAGKRPLMAGIAEQYADRVIVTDDNPRTESAQQIFADIRAGFAQPQQVIFEHDRALAIRQAINLAKAGDAVVIAGKGHETVQIVHQEQRLFDDRQQARQALQELAA